MDVPTLSREEIQKYVANLTLGMHLGYLGFIGEKLGQDAVKEVVARGAEAEAGAVAQSLPEYDGALKLAMHMAVDAKNIYGSDDVTMDGDENQATVSIGKCSSLIAVDDFIKKGAPVTRGQGCGGCSGHSIQVAGNLGLKAEFSRTENGCKYTLSK